MAFHTNNLGWLGESCRKVSLALLILLFTPVYLSAETEIPVLTTDTKLATAGYFQLSWQPGATGATNKIFHFELQQSKDRSFFASHSIYLGSDRASVISGKSNGDYFYRVRSIDSPAVKSDWSNTIHVSVQHHSLLKAWLFFSAGGIVFLFTLVFIVSSASNGNRD